MDAGKPQCTKKEGSRSSPLRKNLLTTLVAMPPSTRPALPGPCDVVGVAVARAGRQDERQVASRPVADSSVAEQRVAVSELEVANCDDVAPEAVRRRAGRHRADLSGPRCLLALSLAPAQLPAS